MFLSAAFILIGIILFFGSLIYLRTTYKNTPDFTFGDGFLDILSIIEHNRIAISVLVLGAILFFVGIIVSSACLL